MRLIVTGATSFLGAWLCERAAGRHDVLALGHGLCLRPRPGLVCHQLNLASPQSLGLLRAWQADAVVHTAFKVMGSGDRGPRGEAVRRLNRAMMDTVLHIGAPVLYASSTCVHWPRETAYARARRDDEARLAASGLPWAVMRPCAPFGPPLPHHAPGHTESFHTLVRSVRRRVVPVPGDGEALRQPIHVDDFAEAALALIERGLPGLCFDAGGADALSFNAIVDTLAHHARRRVIKVPVPVQAMALAGRVLPDLEPELLLASLTDDVADPGPLEAATGVRMRGFRQAATCLLEA